MTPAESPNGEVGQASLKRGKRVAELLGLTDPVRRPLPTPVRPQGGPLDDRERPLWKPLAAVVVLLFLASVNLSENESERPGKEHARVDIPATAPPRRGRPHLDPPPLSLVPPAVADDRLDLPHESVWQGTVRHEGEHCLAELSLRRKEGAVLTGVLSWERRGTRHSVVIAGRTSGSRLWFESGTVHAGTALTNVRGALASFHEGKSLSGDYWGGATQGGPIRLVRKD